jgi:hypothetical protein
MYGAVPVIGTKTRAETDKIAISKIDFFIVSPFVSNSYNYLQYIDHEAIE